MIADAIGLVLAPGLGAAISPMAIVAVLVLLTAKGGRSRALMFALGVLVSTLALAAVALILALSAQVHTGGGGSKIGAGVSLALGLLLVWFAFKQWRKRPKVGQEAASPKWMASLDTATGIKSFALGAGLALLNAKNIPLALATITNVVQLGAAPWVNIVAILLFAVLGSLGVVVPLVAAAIGGSALAAKLQETKAYLVQHNAIILCVVFLLLGADTIGKSIIHLFA